MPQPTKGPRLGGSPSHQRLILANLATSLFTHGRITTTEAKAKRLRPYAERLITKAKRNDLHNRREIQKVIRDKAVVHRLLAEIGPLFTNRDGGYTRITKTMPRKGDNAPMAVIELITSETVATEEAPKAETVATDEATTAPAEESASTEDAPYGAGSHAALPDGGEPEGFPVKGNDSSKLYHLPGTSHYDRTVAEVWFADADAAEAAGFALPPSQREDEDGS